MAPPAPLTAPASPPPAFACSKVTCPGSGRLQIDDHGVQRRTTLFGLETGVCQRPQQARQVIDAQARKKLTAR